MNDDSPHGGNLLGEGDAIVQILQLIEIDEGSFCQRQAAGPLDTASSINARAIPAATVGSGTATVPFATCGHVIDTWRHVHQFCRGIYYAASTHKAKGQAR